MRIDILTLFPEMFAGPFSESILKRASDKGLIEIRLYQIRDYTHDKHHVVDDTPYGGGAGMVMKPGPVVEAIEAVKGLSGDEARVILLSPSGRLFNEAIAADLASKPRLILIAGHYEGFDERVRAFIDDELSIGDYVLSGGEIPAMVIVDAVSRLVPGVLGSEESQVEESHSQGLLEYPHYTRPPEFRGLPVPEVLLSGNHAKIAKWRRKESLKRTFEHRPDLMENVTLSKTDQKLLAEIKSESDSEMRERLAEPEA
ncbi:tRNA (guanosine(37)-N1)-methyltransferase TrmD [Dehalogenimonas etheniformans]|uniref:tRNA (guanine-N(1)-)-methyltransferase n=1 Tax=Dehalogenimonas etheniformans TaxID=1536648 RepID=A0A2P5P6T0_9CHLR|nr:tRNA (guanosine(37)-N1)-methyltransferase TrmD [Dehalogenimonas etheniformans]PPD58003.1 tRNA (guanosine(37)-N1)-methyltransferase TrmD [Dehalogenimonas etheniformans]QNT75352.1 tRNA (guanosine(37)-N1)-methyltransferase TrmD [Dehalogenimonas etheniformans]